MKKIISAAEFMQQHAAPERSKLAPFRDDILLLKENGYTDNQVLDFLTANGVRVAQSTLNQFIKKKRQSLHVSGSLKKEIPNPELHEEKIQESETVRRGLRRPTPTKKFNWEDKPDPETLK